MAMTQKVKRRHRDIIRLLETEGEVFTGTVAARFKVTKETVRTDFDHIAKVYGYERVHGGLKVRAHEEATMTYFYQRQSAEHMEVKKQIAHRAVDLISDHDCIYLDGGSTTACLMRYLSRRRHLTVVTPSVAILLSYVLEGGAEAFEEAGHRLVFIGGAVDLAIHTTYGVVFDAAIEAYNFDAVLASCDSVDLEAGGSNRDEVAHRVAVGAAKRAKRVVLMADSSKFHQVRPYSTFQWEKVHYLVTDCVLDPSAEAQLKQKNVVYYKA
ncbi:DeoR/GlpR family DNA-binding transcription regulator [Fusibacter sp. JL298sf-3]